MGKSSAPSAPNPAALAAQQQQANIATSTANTESNAINKTGPTSSLQYTVTGQNPDGTPIYSQTQSLAAPLQSGLNSYMNTIQGNAANGYNTSNIPALQSNAGVSTGDLTNAFNQQQGAAYQNQMNYLQPQEQQQTAQLNDSLAQQGITQESNPTAYSNAMTLNNNNQTFNNQAAYNSSYQSGLAGANQLFNQGAMNAGLNNSANSQGMTNMFNMQSAPLANAQSLYNLGASNTQTPMTAAQSAPNVMGAAQSAYQSQLASYNNSQSGLFGLGGSALMSPTGTFSGMGNALSGAGSWLGGLFGGGAAAGGASAAGSSDLMGTMAAMA